MSSNRAKSITKLKKILKKNTQIRNLAEGYGSSFLYGYIHSDYQVRKFVKRLKKREPQKKSPYSGNKEDVFVFIGDKNIDSTMRVAVFGDIDEKKVKNHNCIYYTARMLKNEKYRKIHDLHFKIHKKIPVPMKRYWDKAYTTMDIRSLIDKNIIVIFMVGPYYEETYSQPLLFDLINQISGKTFCKKVMYLVDPVDKYVGLTNWFEYFDLIATYSQEDAIKYKINYIDSPCVSLSIDKPKIYSDIHTRCIDAGRGDFIKECNLYFEEQEVICDFHIQSEKNEIISKGMEYTTKRKSYRDTVTEELGANVLLEVLIPGINSGPTLRYKEAVIYNKKLLTTNINAESLPCFDSKYMRIIRNPKEVDINWIKEKTPVRYVYHGEFSVDNFCESLIKFLNI